MFNAKKTHYTKIVAPDRKSHDQNFTFTHTNFKIQLKVSRKYIVIRGKHMSRSPNLISDLIENRKKNQVANYLSIVFSISHGFDKYYDKK